MQSVANYKTTHFKKRAGGRLLLKNCPREYKSQAKKGEKVTAGRENSKAKKLLIRNLIFDLWVFCFKSRLFVHSMAFMLKVAEPWSPTEQGKHRERNIKPERI